MAEKDKKRKRDAASSETPRKKKSSEKTSQNKRLQIQVLPTDSQYVPVIAATPGLHMSGSLGLQAYRKPAANSKTELLLHSTQHAALNYTARQCQEGSLDAHLKHYIGVYDPSTNTLKVVEATKMILKSSVKAEDEEMKLARANAELPKTNLSRRQQLTSEFGTKKAKKALSSITENAITSRNGEAVNVASLSAGQAAVLSSMDAAATLAPTKEARQALADAGKPRPPRNESAETAGEVYTPERVVGDRMLSAIRVKPWVQAIENNEEIKLFTRYIINRLPKLVKNSEEFDIKRLKTLRYLYILLRWHQLLEPGRDGGKRQPKKEILEKELSVESGVMDDVKKLFCNSSGDITKLHLDKLRMYICALALICDGGETDTYDLQMDLGLKQAQMTLYFGECGVKLRPPSELQKSVNNWNPSTASMHKFAKIKLPLEFPKASMGARARKK